MKETHLTDSKFSDFALHPKVIEGLKLATYIHCTPIQALSIPLAIEGRDIAGQAQTGTGKTIAFLTSTFHHLLTKQPSGSGSVRALIMAPTRELAIQIHKDALPLAEATGFKMGLAYGGEGYDSQKETLEAGVDILVGTTGRLIDYLKQGIYNLNNIEVVVLDEADRMFDLGFIKDIRYLFRRMPAPNERFNMLFSATLSFKVQELAYEHMNEPTHVHVQPQQMTAKKIKEELFYPSNQDKMSLLLTLMEEEWPDKAMVFTNTKHSCEDVYNWLKADKHRVGLLTGDIPQKKRLRILEQFAEGQLDILVATDVAARGLHIPEVTHVFNYDLPDDCEDYVHRIGRTGRAGSSGHAISFACEKYAINLTTIEQYINHPIPVADYNSAELLDDIQTPKPKPKRRHQSGKSYNKRRN